MDEAWAEVIAALPDGWLPPSISPAMDLDTKVGPNKPYPLPVTKWRAGTMRADWKADIEAIGDTPVLALQALAETCRRLREDAP